MELNTTRGKPLGTGRMYPAGSLADRRLLDILASYKRNVAGAYSSVSPDAVSTVFPSGYHIVSTKVDGEQWFLCKDEDDTNLVSPNGKIITGVPVTDEAKTILSDWSGILAGELYSAVDTGRPRVYDLHSALGCGIDAQVDRLRFAAFDIVMNDGQGMVSAPYSERANSIKELLPGGKYIHPVDFAQVKGPDEIASFFHDRCESGEEGIVIHSSDGRIFKVKPVISIDAVVVAYTSATHGIGELLLGLMPNDSETMRIIGRVDTGFSAAERNDIATRLEPLHCESSVHLSSRSGLPYHWVLPKLVVEVSCHELLTRNSDGEPIRRWSLNHSDSGWTPMGKVPSVSLRDAVFVRIREDKSAKTPEVRWSQITDIVAIGDKSADLSNLPSSQIIRREVYTRRIRDYGIAVRKFVVWKTNKDEIDSRYPAFAVIFTDYSPARQDPLKTELQVASSVERLASIIQNWLDENTGRGWECVSTSGDPLPQSAERENIVHSADHSHTLTISFARSTSPTFPIVRRRLDALSELGALNITKDDSGKEVWFDLSIHGGLIENYRRITNLLSLVRRWKSAEMCLDGEVLTKYDIDGLLERAEEIRRCWMRHKTVGSGGCRRDSMLGCRCLRITPSERFLEGAFISEPQWYAVGRFDGKQVQIDKDSLIAQVGRRRNGLLECCPCFSKDAVASAIQKLPGAIAHDTPGYQLMYKRDDGLPAWIWPEHAPLPPRLAAKGAQVRSESQGSSIQSPFHGQSMIQMKRPSIPPATYADVCGQDEAVEAVRDMIELPMKHAHLFGSVGVSPRAGGIILAGPPGTGKTLLARAVAGECGAHLEVVSGPELLNPYVGATEQAIRDVFERAKKNAPSLVLFDELDSIAPSRSMVDAHHQQTLVAQLLTLLDGIEGRSGISVLATTNRPKYIDPALRRPGRFDTMVWMKLPDERGRAAILRRYLTPLRLDTSIDRDALALDLAAVTDGASGADLEQGFCIITSAWKFA